MKSQLYLDVYKRKRLISEIILYKETYLGKIMPVFGEVEKEADKMSQDYYDEVMDSYSADGMGVDPAEVAERAEEIGIDYYEDITLMKYNSLGMWIIMMYQFWEQQVRKFLYEEMIHCFSLEMKDFCTRGINDFKNKFEFHNIKIDELDSWDEITELRLLSNTLKHGDGRSAQKLKKRHPKYFENGLDKHFEDDFGDLFQLDFLDLYNSTLLEKVLNISSDDFQRLCDALINFWKTLPERMHSEEIK